MRRAERRGAGAGALRMVLALGLTCAPAPLPAEAVAPADRVAGARSRLEALRGAVFPPGLSRRDLIALRLRPGAAGPPAPAVLPPGVPALLDLVALAEAGPAGYDAVHHRATVPPPAPPSRLTLGEVLDWVAATPGQPHAIGRYQFVPATLSDLMRREGLPRQARFDAALQDRLAIRLMRDAGLDDFLAGRMEAAAFMDELAYVWAGLPLASGLSAYHGFNGNRATLSRARYLQAFRAAFAR